MSIDVLPLNTAATAYTKAGGSQAVRSKILITVKASPVPSTTYGDTVCVAGIDITNDEYRWVRLYPVPHRHVAENVKFKKYDIVEVPLTPRAKDVRSESYTPDLSSLHTIAHLDRWTHRHPYLEPFVDVWTMCQIQQAVRSKSLAPSLAVVRPREVGTLEIAKHPGWDDATIKKMQAHADQGDLFARDTHYRGILEAPPLQAWYKYKCFTPECKGHRQGLLDWEFTALQRNLKDCSLGELRAKVTEKFLNQMTQPGHGPLFFVGNQLKRLHVFSVLGVYRSIA